MTYPVFSLQGGNHSVEKLKLYIEKYGPFGMSVAAVVVWLFFGAPFPQKSGNILISSISFGAIVTGFLSTTEGILLTINPKSRLISGLYSSTHLAAIISYLAHAIRVGISFSVISLLMLLDAKVANFFYTKIAWVFLATLLIFSFFIITEIIIKILRLPPTMR